jgi:hypothetical protein
VRSSSPPVFGGILSGETVISPEPFIQEVYQEADTAKRKYISDWMKIIELNHNQTKDFTNSFKSVDEAIIIENISG